ncbi:MFS transporter, partial [Paenibacillus sepulcri]|nr:MFS transporter [Paenibacillus sepulcri]
VCTAQSLTWIYIASLAVGITTVVPQILIPLSAQMASPQERGKVIGTVMSGLLLGILLARTVAGLIGGAWGWRTMYAIAAALMLGLLIVLRAKLPRSQPGMTASYTELIKSIGGLIRQFSTLREAALIGAAMFGGFSVFWTSLAFFLEGGTYGYSSQVAGLFGLVGVVGASGAPVVGRLSDRFQPKVLAGLLIAVTFVSYLFFGFAGTSLWGLIVGIILLDLGVQGTQIS